MNEVSEARRSRAIALRETNRARRVLSAEAKKEGPAQNFTQADLVLSPQHSNRRDGMPAVRAGTMLPLQ
ncbi:MAG: hypothetical protein M3Y67_04720 [Pseudomonadota bacterium]|nr:hypothetical protein [Pseudomonadota bacterium]